MTAFERGRALLLMDDTEQCEFITRGLKNMGYDAIAPRDLKSLEATVSNDQITFGILRLPWNGRHADSVFRELQAMPRMPDLRWLVILPEDHSENRESLFRYGVVGILPLPVRSKDMAEEVETLERCIEDPVYEITNALEFVSGVQLRSEKRSLVESRLHRRVHALHMASINDYAKYFLSHKTMELPKALSLVTTHTTEFFREEAHFDYLFDHVFPRLFAEKNQITIWSAASSTGQEVYSLAISVLEYMRTKGIPSDLYKIVVEGTDIDLASLETAREGVYRREQIQGLSSDLITRYFDEGTGSLADYVRVKDDVHRLCRFNRLNLMADTFPFRGVSLIFLRNAMIYFKPQDVTNIVSKMARTLAADGLLFVGHSESLSGLKTPYQKLGHAIYQLASAQLENASAEMKLKKPSLRDESVPVRSFAPHLSIELNKSEAADSVPVHSGNMIPLSDVKKIRNLIVIGASTGGVEALKTLLEQFPVGCPPVLIVQHIPAGFSTALARRLNETCRIAVKEAVDGEILQESHVYVAPGGKQMRLVRGPSNLYLEINDDAPVRLHKPSVDYLFNSVVPVLKHVRVAAAILTGMGADGAQGLKSLRDAGAYTIAQDEETSVVYGMPGAAVKLHAAKEVLPLSMIAMRLLHVFKA